MKQIALSFIVIGIFGIYAVMDRQQTKLQTTTISAPQPTITNNNTYKDGQYTGVVADALYGNLQVKAVITNGKISDVIFLDYPHDKQTSREINGQAMPILKSEAISAQVAQVDIVSGATQTSGAFMQSLQSALDQAKI